MTFTARKVMMMLRLKSTQDCKYYDHIIKFINVIKIMILRIYVKKFSSNDMSVICHGWHHGIIIICTSITYVIFLQKENNFIDERTNFAIT